MKVKLQDIASDARGIRFPERLMVQFDFGCMKARMASWNCSGAQSGIAKFSKRDDGLRKNKSFVKDIVEAQRQVHPGRSPEGHSLSSERRGRSKNMLVLTWPHSLFFECLISSKLSKLSLLNMLLPFQPSAASVWNNSFWVSYRSSCRMLRSSRSRQGTSRMTHD